MGTAPKYLIVEADALPEVFQKVVRMKELLELGVVDTVNEAAEAAGVSRSAFYKYKDAVRPFRERKGEQIVTFQFQLHNRPGVLSQLLNIFAQTGGNILTINQGLPVDNRAVATIAAETSDLKTSMEELLARVGAVEGVLNCQIIGE